MNANLMFEVGVKEAGTKISDLEKKLDALVAKYGTMKIAVEISNLDTFVNALKSIGNGEQLKPLLDRIQTLQNRLGALGDKGQYFDMLRGNAAAAAKEVEKAEKYLAAMQKTGNTGFIASAKDSLQRAQVEATRANEMLASAMERVAKEETKTSATSNELRTKIDAVGQSVSDLQAKLGNGIHINLDTSKFGPLTEQIQSLATETSGLITQLKTLSQVQSQPTNNEAIKTQTKDVENLAKAKDKLTESNKKAADSQASDESTNKVTNTYERYLRLLLEIENQMAAIGKIQLFGEQSGFSPTILKRAVDEFEKLKTVVDATIKGKPIAEGLAIPMTPEQLSQFVAQFSLLKTAYKDIVSEADKFNKQSERDFANAQKTVQSEIDKTISKLKALDESIKRGEVSGRDMSVLSDAQSKLKGQLGILQKMTNSDYADSKIVEKRISNIRQLREDTENLRKVEEKLTSAREKLNKAKDKDDRKRLNDEIKSLNEAWIKYNELTAKIKELESLRDRGIKANIDITQIDSAIARYHDLKVAMMEIINNDGRNLRGNLTSQVWGDHNTKKYMQDAVADAKAYTQSLNDVEKRMRTAATAAEGLGKRIDALEARKVDFKGLDTTRLDAAIQRVKDIRAELERFSQTGQSVHGVNANEIIRNMGLAAAKKEAADATEQLNRQLKQNTRESERASAMANQLSDAEQRLAHAIKGTNDSMKGQVNIIADLKTMATQYLGVWGAQNFVHNIIQIGGQLEQQRLSIGAILGDMAAGQHLFDQIKQLALTSPFGVMELDKDTKQLSAYGFKQSELFDMTKRLADISAGAGTEVSRLALALGHVRSEGALTGYTLRQFAMNNIPMLQKLSERLTKLEGQIVSTAEIRKRVSKKEIGYEDVIAVIKDLTNEGGMFFNMQETMADAVNAKFKNLKDSMDIMYGEMAEGGIGSALKWVAETLMSLTRNWEKTARVIGYGTAAFVAYRLAVTSANTQLLTYGSTLGATSKTLNAKAIALGVNTAAVKRLTADEVNELVTLKLVNREQLLNAVATKKLTVDQAELAAATFNVTRAELTSIASKGKLGVASAGLSLRLKGLALSLRGVGTALRTMLLNPVGIALMTITAGFEVFMRWKQRNSEIEESIEQLGKKGSEGYKNLAATLDKYSGNDGKMSESEYSTAISDIIDSLKNYAPNIHNIQEEAQSIDDLAERYRYLRDELESTKNAYADLERTKAFASNANEATGNILNDTFTENVEDYIENVQKVDKAEQELMQHRIALEKTLDELERKTAFKRLKDSNGNALPLIEQLKYIKNTDWKSVFAPMLMSNSYGAAEAFNDFGVAMKNMSDTMRNEVMPDLQNFANRLNNQYAGTFGKDWKENADHVKTAWMAVVSEIDKVPGMTDNVKRELLEKIFNETWKLNIDFSTGEVTESLTGWRKEMQDWLDENGLKFRIGFGDSREDIYKKAKAAQEAAQTEMNNAGKVLISIGFKLNNLPKELPSPLQTPWNQKNLEDYVEQKAIDDTWEKFQKHFGADWQTKQDKANAKKNKGRNDDKEAKRLREVVKLYKDAFDWYNKYEKQVGKDSALSKVQEQFKPLFDQFSDQFKQTLSLDSIPLYKENLESLLAEAEKLYQDPKHKNSYMVDAINQIRDAINNVDFEELGNKQDEFLSKTQIQLDNLTRSWETFNSVRDATGNIELAVQLSGAGYQAGANVNIADALRKKIEGDFAAAGAIAIPFDINFSGKEIFNRISAAMPEKTQEQIKGIVEEYKKWRDLQRDVVKNDTSVFLKAWDDEYDRKQEFDKIVSQYEESKKSLDTLLRQWLSGAIDANGNRLGITREQYNRAFGNLTIRTDWEKFKNENDFKWVFDNIGTTSLDTIQKMIKAMREYAKTTEMGEKETKAWHEAMDKLLDQESILNPLQSIADAAKSYSDAVAKRKNAEEALRISKMSRAERRRNGINENDVVPLQQAQDDYRQALSDEEKALLRVTKAINAFANKVSELGSALSSLGSSIGGEFGDIMNGVGGMLGDLGNGMNSATKLAEAMKTKGFSGTIGKVTATIGIINSIVDFNQKLDSILPSSESIYQKYADRQRKINELQEQIADYQVEALKRQIEETNWLYNEGLSELRNQGYVKKNLLKEYANSMLRPQEIYQEARSGISKWGPAIVGAIVGVVGAVLTLGIGSIGSAALGATIAGVLGATATAAVGAALAAGAGAAIGTALRSAADQFFYGEGQTSARENMRVQTQHKTFFRGEKTQNLEDWVRDNYGKELFDKDHYDLIDIELAKQILEDGPTLVGETRETLERLVEYAEQIREIEDGVKEYVSQMFSPLVENMTDALWDWLDTGKDILDSFEDYASDTFKNIAKDAVKSFLKINLIDKYQDKLNEIYTAYSLGVYNEQELGLAVASVAGEIKTSLESLSPALQVLGETLENAFETQGYDIVNGSKSSSSSASTTIKSVTEQTADLIASYLNAVRADVSVNRTMIAQYFPLYYQTLTSSNETLGSIAMNTRAIMESNATIAQRVSNLDDSINGLKNRVWRLPVS